MSPTIFIVSCVSGGSKLDSDPIIAIETNNSTLPINHTEVINSGLPGSSAKVAQNSNKLNLTGTYVSELIHISFWSQKP